MHLLVTVFLLAALPTLLLTPGVRACARRLGMVAKPARDRWHEAPTALLGGVAIYAGFLVGSFATVALVARRLALPRMEGPILGLVGAASIMFLIGLADDRFRFRPATKLGLQIVAAAFAVTCGVVYQLTPWGIPNVLLTIFWYLALSNALNLLDNMDGVAAGVAAIAGFFLGVTFAAGGHWLLAGICIALAGATAGFLPYNFHRATIFMGDSGSLLIGSVLAGLGALFPTVAAGSIVAVFFVPALIVIIPILDTSLVTLARTLAGRPISVGGRDHTAHRLVAMGLTQSQAALALYAFAAAGGCAALAIQQTELGYGLWLGGLFLTALLLFAAYLTRLHTYSALEAAARPRLTLLVSNLFHKRGVLQLTVDVLIFTTSYYGAFLLRYDAPLRGADAELLGRTLALVIAAKVVGFSALGVYRGMWLYTSFADLHRILRAAVASSLLAIAALFLMNHGLGVPRGVMVIDFLLTAGLSLAARASFRSLEALRDGLTSRGEGVIVYGAGRRAELLLRELRGNPQHGLVPVAVLDDDPATRGTLLHGLPVLAGAEHVATIARTYAATRVVLASEQEAPERLSALLAACEQAQLGVLRFGVVLEPLPGAGEVRPEVVARGALRVLAVDARPAASDR